MASGGEPPDKGGGSKDWNMEMQNEQTQPQNGKPAELKGQQDEKNNAKISYTYVRSDVGPYRVFIELKNNTKGKASINKYTLGSYLRKIQGIHTYIQELQYAGKHKVIAILTNPEKANQLVTEINNSTSAYRAYVPRHVVSITGVIAGIPIDLTEQEIQDDIQSKVPVMSVKRLHRYADGNKVLSLRVSVTFRAKELPDSVKVFCCPTRVYPFAQKLIFCTKCLRYGHRTENCRGRERCRNCGQIHELNEEYANCQEQQKCIYCKSTDHRSGATICDETQRQKALKSIMAKKNLTQLEARRLLPAKISNYYEPLSRQDEFPSISDSFANTVTRSQKPQRSRQRSRSNEDDKRVTSNEGHQQSKNTTTNEKNEDVYSRLVKRARQNEGFGTKTGAIHKQIVQQYQLPTTPGVGLNNTQKTTETEKWKQIVQKEKENAQQEAKQHINNVLMKFYTEFIVREGKDSPMADRLKNWSKEHIDLESVII